MSVPGDGLARRSTIAFLWGTGGSVARIFLQLVAQIVLARLVGPADYGLFALGVVVVGLSSYFADMGIAYGLIQRTSITSDDIRFVWTWQLLLGLAVASVVWLGAHGLAQVFAKPDAAPIFKWLSLVCLLNALAAVSVNLLRKALDYRALQVGQVGGYAAGFLLVGIPAAALGMGVDALVAAWLVQSVVTLTALYLFVRHPVSLRLWVADGSAILRYGATVLATNLVNGLLTAADKLVAGRMFTAHVVGVYTTAFNLVNSPAAAAYGTLQSVVFASCARLQGNQQALRDVFLGLLSAIALTAFPAFGAISVGADLIVVGLFGAAWADAAPFLAVFATAMPFLLLWGIATPMLWNSGRTRLEVWLQLPMIAIWAVALALAASMSASMLALTAAGLFAARCLVMVGAAVRTLGIAPGEVVRAIAPGAVLTIAMVAAAVAAHQSIARAIAQPQFALTAFALCCVTIYVLLVLAFAPRLIDPRLAAWLDRDAQRIPRPLRPVARALVRGRGRR